MKKGRWGRPKIPIPPAFEEYIEELKSEDVDWLSFGHDSKIYYAIKLWEDEDSYTISIVEEKYKTDLIET